MASELARLARKLSKALEDGRGLCFTADDLDQLAAIGVNELVQAEAAKELRTAAERRQAEREESNPAAQRRTTSIVSKEEADEARQRAMRILRPGRAATRPPQKST